MPEAVERKVGAFDLRKAVDLLTAVAALLAPAAVFYALGYIIIQAYVAAVQVNATFWFNEYFYREAGANLLLAAIGAVVLLPHVFIPLSVLLFLFLPGREGGWRDRLFDSRALHAAAGSSGIGIGSFPLSISRRARSLIFLGIVLTLVGIIVLLLRNAEISSSAESEGRWQRVGWFFSDEWVFPRWFLDQLDVARPLRHPTAVLLALAVPALVALGGRAYGAFRGSKAEAQGQDAPGPMARGAHPLSGSIWLVSTLMLGTYVAVGYGAFFYDVGAVPMVDPEECRPASPGEDATNGAAADTRIRDCFMLARFDDRYILFGWQTPSEGQGRGVAPIYVKQVKDIEPLSVSISAGFPLRSLRNSYEKMAMTQPTPPAAGAERAPKTEGAR